MAHGAIRVALAPSALFNVMFLGVCKAGVFFRATVVAFGFNPDKRVFNGACA